VNFRLDQTENIGVLSFQGSLTQAHASAIREILMASWEKTRYIIINLEDVTQMDEPCLRIFCKAYRLALMTNKLFAIAAISSGALEHIARNPSLCYSECHTEFPMPELPFGCIRNCLWGIKGGPFR
jgi:anti-anti-sigma factor